MGTYSDPILKKGEGERVITLFFIFKGLDAFPNGFIHFEKISIFLPMPYIGNSSWLFIYAKNDVCTAWGRYENPDTAVLAIPAQFF